MNTLVSKRVVFVVAALLSAGSVAYAQQLNPSLGSFQAGGGVSDFTGAAASNLTHIGAEWDVRLGVNIHQPIHLEAAYVGSTHPIGSTLAPFAPGGSSIMANGLEGLAVWDMPLHLVVQPFLFGGAGWDHWSLSGGAQNNPLAIKGSDDTLSLPFGGGVAWDFARHWDLDGRFTYRTTLLDDMLQTNSAGQPNSGSKSLTTWTATLRAGYVF